MDNNIIINNRKMGVRDWISVIMFIGGIGGLYSGYRVNDNKQDMRLDALEKFTQDTSRAMEGYMRRTARDFEKVNDKIDEIKDAVSDLKVAIEKK